MTSNVRLGFVLGPLLVLSIAALPIGADRLADPPFDLTVHEWGTFTSVAGADGSAIEWDALGCKDDLPGFVNDFGYRGFKWRLSGTVRMETPVLYFYSPREVDAQVKVSFPQGLITEWYPQADYAVYQTNGRAGSWRRLEPHLNGIDTSLRSVTGAIEWNHVKVQPNTAPVLPLESEPGRYYAARETDSAPVAVGDQHEKFLFYRGVGRFAVPLSARLSSEGKMLIENRGHEAVPMAILFENRGGHLGYRNAGVIAGAVTVDTPLLDDALPQLRYDLETVLVEQGLFQKEAQAMVETWRDSWFEEGVRLIYIMPAPAVDAILPLQVEPAPLRTARVFVGRIELITPDVVRSVEDALLQKDVTTLDRRRRFRGPVLQRIASDNVERANRDHQLLRQVDESTEAKPCR